MLRRRIALPLALLAAAAVAGPVVDQVASFHRPLVSALGVLDVNGEGFEVAQVVGDAVGEEGFRLREPLGRAGKLGLVALGQ